MTHNLWRNKRPPSTAVQRCTTRVLNTALHAPAEESLVSAQTPSWSVFVGKIKFSEIITFA